MERRFLLAIVLSIGVIFAWQTFIARKPRPAEPGKDAPAAPGNGQPAPAPAGAPDPVAPAPAPAPPPGPAARQSAEHQEFVLEPTGGEFLRIGYTTRGAAITELTLRNAFEESVRETPKGQTRWPLDLLLAPFPDHLTGMVELAKGDAEGMRRLDWTVEARTATEVAFSFLTSTGLKIVKTYTIPLEADRYDIGLSFRVERTEGAASKDEIQTLRVLGPAGYVGEPSNHTGMETATQSYLWITGRSSEPEVEDAGISPAVLDPLQSEQRAFRLVGVRSHFFTAALWSPGGEAAPRVREAWVEGGNDGNVSPDAGFRRLVDWFQTARKRSVAADPALGERLKSAATHCHRPWAEIEVPVSAAGAASTAGATLHLFAGPLSRRVLAQDRYQALDPLIAYPFAFDVVARFLLFIFDLGFGLTGSAGLAVLIMTLVVRGGLMPISIRNQLSMRAHGRKVSRLKPKLDALKAKWAKDPKRFREEQVKLMKEHGVGFPMGCLLMFLQIPIFFALFSSLRVEYAIRHEAFGWIADLSGPDRLIDFGLSAPLVGFPPGGIWGFNLLPVLYMGLAIWQQRLMPKPQDEQQAQQMKMAKWMSIIFPILLYNYTAALALYMCASSLVALVESRIVRAKDRHDQEQADPVA